MRAHQEYLAAQRMADATAALMEQAKASADQAATAAGGAAAAVAAPPAASVADSDSPLPSARTELNRTTSSEVASFKRKMEEKEREYQRNAMRDAGALLQ